MEKIVVKKVVAKKIVKKAEQSARTRAALIDSAILLFGERGFRATSLKAIGEHAGISTGVIPFHFGSKDGLLQAATEACFEAFRDAVMGPLLARDSDFGLGDVRALMKAQSAFQDAHPEVGRFFQVLMYEALGPSPALRPRFHELYDRLHELGCAWIRAGQSARALDPTLDVEAAVGAMLCFFTGLRTHSLLVPDRIPRARIEKTMLAILEHGAVAGGEPR